MSAVVTQNRMGRKPKRTQEEVPAWARRLRQARENKGLSQMQLGEAIGASDRSISNWENGTHQPDLTQFEAVAAATDTNVIWITWGVGGQPEGTCAVCGIMREANEADRHLIWALYQAWLFFNEERLEPNWEEVVSFIHHVLAAAQDSPDQAHAKEAISRKIEAERAGLRADIEKARKKPFNPGNPEFSS